MSRDPHDPARTQEQSIKARKHQLFEDEEPVGGGGSSVPFEELLRTTPAEPLSGPVKAMLWAIGVVVALLLAASLLTSGKSRAPRKAADAARDAGFVVAGRAG